MSAALPGAVLALVVVGAVLLLGSWLRARRPLPIAERIGPFVGTAAGASPLAVDATIPLPVLSRERRRARSSVDASWSAAGGVVGLVLAALLTADDPRPVAWLALGATGAVAGRSLQHLRSRVRAARAHRSIEEQVPVLADLLALAVSAGAAPMAALDRSAAVLSGPLAEHLATCVGRLRTGMPMDAALEAMAREAQVPSLTRLLDAIAVAQERGTPLTDVLRAQAADARSDERRRLLELAGRKDVAMLVPIVFLVLPTVILIAVFPGIRALEVVVP